MVPMPMSVQMDAGAVRVGPYGDQQVFDKHIDDSQHHTLGSDPHLGPYLADIDLPDAVESFAQLADKLIYQQQSNPLNYNNSTNNDNSCESMSTYVPSSSSPLLSAPSSSSPALSDYRSSWSPPTSSSSPLSSSMSSRSSQYDGSYGSYIGSSGPSSVASSLACHDPSSRPISSRSSSSRSSTSSSSSTGISRTATGRAPEKRKRKNATAAERYRHKLKGRKFSLAEQVEQEEARQQRLRRQIESKLILYKEFVDLLARNTSSQDEELAEIGEKSLLNVLRLVHPTSEQESSDLWSYLEHFRSISESSSSDSSSSESTDTTTTTVSSAAASAANIMDVDNNGERINDNELVYDFYADQWVHPQQQQQQQQLANRCLVKSATNNDMSQIQQVAPLAR